MISERPAEVTDRAVPGHWEGDLITGTQNKTAIGTLVERSTRFVMLLHLPKGHSPTQVEQAIVDATQKLPDFFWKSLTLRVGDTWPMFLWPAGFAATAINIARLPREGWPERMIKSSVWWARVAVISGIQVQ